MGNGRRLFFTTIQNPFKQFLSNRGVLEDTPASSGQSLPPVPAPVQVVIIGSPLTNPAYKPTMLIHKHVPLSHSVLKHKVNVAQFFII